MERNAEFSFMERLDDGPAKDMEILYLKKKDQGDIVDGTQSQCLDKHFLLPPLTSVPICTQGARECLIVGRFYEIDHSKLPLKCPDHLKFVRVVMLSDVGELQVSVRYPSMQSLRTQFNDADHGKPDKKIIPPLDEKYVMESGFAGNALCRRVSTKELVERGKSMTFWITTAEEDQRGKSTLFIDEETDLVSKMGSCWSQLKYSGMIQWGKRRPVRFLGQHEKNNLESLSGSVKDTGSEVKEQNERVEMSDRKRKKCEEKELTKVSRTTRNSKRNKKRCSEVQRLKNAQHGRQNQLVVYKKRKHKVSTDRWSAERYKLAEENMLKVLKAKGAVFEKPILRPALRSEARKLIGDTGLLDHLLKHMAGKVAPGGTERFRRRHNAEGAMEYWLESADLVKIRQKAGVQDPYWTPPAGWKPGDNPSRDPICAKEFGEMREEMSKIKHEMQQLVSMRRGERLAIVTTTDSCLSDNFNSEERSGSLATTQEMYMELVNKKFKIEEHLKDIAMALTDMEEVMMMLKAREEVAAAALMPATRVVLVAVGNGAAAETEKEEEGHKKSEVEEGEEEDIEGRMRTESRGQAAAAEEDRAAKIERLKSGFRICQPHHCQGQGGGFVIWPNNIMSPNPPPDVVPIPSSAAASFSSSSSSSSLVKPLAERRPVSPATLTHVTIMSSFTPPPPFLSPPPPSSQKPRRPPHNHHPPLINLNEAPPNYDPPSSQPPPPPSPVATEMEASIKKDK